MQTMTQAEKLANIYSTVTGGRALPEEMEAEALKEDTQPESVELPKLHVLVSGENRILADLVCSVTAAIKALDKLYYFEIAATSDSTAHAVAACLVDHSKDSNWEIKGDIFGPKWQSIEAPSNVAIRDTRLKMDGWGGCIHHVAVLTKSNQLIIANNEETLWRKLRARMTCPTLDGWGKDLMPRIHRSGVLIEAQCFGLIENIKAWVIAPDANELFDKIICEHIQKVGLPNDAEPVARSA